MSDWDKVNDSVYFKVTSSNCCSNREKDQITFVNQKPPESRAVTDSRFCPHTTSNEWC